MTNPSSNFSPFLPTTYNLPEDDDRLDVFLYDQLSRFAYAINNKQIGGYTNASENQNGEKWRYVKRDPRTGYQVIAYIPQYPNATTLTLSLTSDPKYPIQNVLPQYAVTKVFGNATKPCSAVGAGDGDYFSFMSQGDSRISFTMSDNQIVITTTVDMRAYSGTIVIEFLKDGI